MDNKVQQIHSFIYKISLLIMAIIWSTSTLSLTHAQTLPHQKYKKCMAMAHNEPEAALNYALDWYIEKREIAALHCDAITRFNLAQYNEAAKKFEEIINRLDTDAELNSHTLNNIPNLKQELYLQTALSYQHAKNYDQAYHYYGYTLSSLDPQALQTYDIYMERGTLQIYRGDYEGAMDDFTQALLINDKSYEPFLQRAKAARKARKYPEAHLDIKMAHALNYNAADILLEEGILYRSQMLNDKAQHAWQTLIDEHPHHDLSQVAKENLSLLEITKP